MDLTVIGSLLGCQQQADQDIKDKIKFVPNKDYVWRPESSRSRKNEING